MAAIIKGVHSDVGNIVIVFMPGMLVFLSCFLMFLTAVLVAVLGRIRDERIHMPIPFLQNSVYRSSLLKSKMESKHIPKEKQFPRAPNSQGFPS